jgi:predicted nucleotidyltransferase
MYELAYESHYGFFSAEEFLEFQKDVCTTVLSQYDEVTNIFLFGSRLAGTSRLDSDWDLYISIASELDPTQKHCFDLRGHRVDVNALPLSDFLCGNSLICILCSHLEHALWWSSYDPSVDIIAKGRLQVNLL